MAADTPPSPVPHRAAHAVESPMSLWLPPMDNDFDDFFVAAGTVLAGEYGELADWRTSPLGHSPQVPSLSTSSSYLQSHAAEDDTGWVNSPATALSNVVYPTLSEAALREPVRLPSPQADLTLGKYTSQARQERLDRWRAKRVLLMQRANDAPAINYTQRQHIARNKPRAGGRFVKSATSPAKRSHQKKKKKKKHG